MVNTERVKQQCKIAFYEQKEEKLYRSSGCFFRSDFIGKEMMKSIFTGTFAYLVMVVLWIFSNLEAVLDSMNDLSIVNTAFAIGLIYIGFLLSYLFITYIVYAYRYANGRKKIKAYKGHLRTLNQMYEREEKLML